ncbi:unnamed protein product [Symbiodinium pilosum]|uniref:Uncharacterized protein n=1 Tax=Symbiodinium pilosum TaxID=2952 RepID=A0A812VMY9_SYMPI|nr:unnamed protein product [Symbiodinium pilosum]
MSASENICLPPSGVLKHDPTHLQQCSSWSLAFRQIEEAAATFIENVYVFNATRIEFFSATQLAVEAIQSYVASEEYTNQLQRVGNKVEFVINAVQSRLNSEDLRLARSRLQTEIDRLKLAAGNLRTVLDEKTELIARFLDECNELYVGTGPSGEYLLDICAQGNIECLENEQFGEHVTCCCGYHPATAYGEVISSQLIDGIASFDAPARVGRRLTGEERAAGSFWYRLVTSWNSRTLRPEAKAVFLSQTPCSTCQ